jgi:hypothetical protein
MDPEYTEEARAAKYQGKVCMRSSDGKATNISTGSLGWDWMRRPRSVKK